MQNLVSTALLLAEASLNAGIVTVWAVPAAMLGAAAGLAGYSTTILGDDAARRASTASHLRQTRSAMPR